MSKGSDGARRPCRALIVIPAYNEERAVRATLIELLATVQDAAVLVVDDGSTDRTVARAREFGVTVLRLPFNIGVGGAMRAGFLYAERHGYDAVVQFDADGQHDPLFIEQLLSGLETADVVVGGRFAKSFAVGRIRRAAMWLVAAAVSRLCRTQLSDATSGFRASGPRAIRLFARYYPAEYLGDTVESLVVAHAAGLVIREQSVVMRPRAGGQPSQSVLTSSLYLARAVLALLLAMTRRRRAMDAAPVGPISVTSGAA